VNIRKWVTVEKEIDVTITAEDIVEALSSVVDETDGQRTILGGINSSIVYLQSVPDRAIEAMTLEQQDIVRKALAEALARFQ